VCCTPLNRQGDLQPAGLPYIGQMRSRPHFCTTPSQRPWGFTLIEAMVSVAILAVLAALAAPSFRTITERMKVSTVTDEISAALTLTRGTAIQNNGNVTLRKLSNTEAGLSGVCNTAENWSCGWRVFRDANGNGTVDAGDEVLYTFPITTQVTVLRPGENERMTANRWGQVNGINAIRFTVAPTSNTLLAASTAICMNSGGRIRVLQGSVTCP